MASKLASVYYHGTAVANLPEVAEHGLVPRPYVWLATDYKTAARWAQRRAGRWQGGVSVYDPYTVLRIKTPTPLPTKSDPNLWGDESSIVTAEAISPDLIEQVVGDVWADKHRWKPLVGRKTPSAINLTVTTEVLAQAMYPEGGLSAFNQGVYPGTRTPLRKLTGKEMVLVRGTSSGADLVTDETWIKDRFGRLGARQVKRLLTLAGT